MEAHSAKALKFVLAKFQPDSSTGKSSCMPIHVMPFIEYSELKEAGHRLVEQSLQKLIKAEFAAKAVCQLGKPAEEIMKVAKGLGAIARFLLGSVSTRAVQHSSCSVLVVR